MHALTSMTDIKAAFARSKLVDIGFSFEDAMNIDPIRRALICAADARRRRIEALKDAQRKGQMPLFGSTTGGIAA